mgnify:CR=1 FL=1
MTKFTTRARALGMAALLAVPAASGLLAQDSGTGAEDAAVTVTGMVPADLSGMPEGPELDGFISARKGDRIQVTSPDGTRTVVAISEASEIRSSGGFLGLDKDKLGQDSLLNGLPVTVRTVQWGNGLIASRIALKDRDLKTATMIRTGTEQGFAEQTAATEALRSRVADIDQYNVKGTTNVYFDTGKWNLDGQSQAELCQTAAQANAMDNALLLVVGYTDAVGDYDYNQTLSERRATRVVNHLQQACGWKPYRMLTPTGMAEADPAADNESEYGRQQNRRVAVNILVSKAVDGM